MSYKRLSPKQQFKMVSEWNKAHPAGTKVTVAKDDQTTLETETTSEAWMLGGHTAVINVRGITGCYALQRVTAL